MWKISEKVHLGILASLWKMTFAYIMSMASLTIWRSEELMKIWDQSHGLNSLLCTKSGDMSILSVTLLLFRMLESLLTNNLEYSKINLGPLPTGCVPTKLKMSLSHPTKLKVTTSVALELLENIRRPLLMSMSQSKSNMKWQPTCICSITPSLGSRLTKSCRGKWLS